ncbi:hypothetical protein CcCBS67573_g02072 [Chytriomyces confervae]|uniref:Centrosomal protein of 162 kDa n=1 Tax=Chytriomyces confervae TaxID=246404 RepID=A0A507FKC1_9FUNG|nr:hypothetical protein CcCBS67573_g02072 [Chytriomyces confervae]
MGSESEGEDRTHALAANKARLDEMRAKREARRTKNTGTRKGKENETSDAQLEEPEKESGRDAWLKKEPTEAKPKETPEPKNIEAAKSTPAAKQTDALIEPIIDSPIHAPAHSTYAPSPKINDADLKDTRDFINALLAEKNSDVMPPVSESPLPKNSTAVVELANVSHSSETHELPTTNKPISSSSNASPNQSISEHYGSDAGSIHSEISVPGNQHLVPLSKDAALSPAKNHNNPWDNDPSLSQNYSSFLSPPHSQEKLAEPNQETDMASDAYSFEFDESDVVVANDTAAPFDHILRNDAFPPSPEIGHLASPTAPVNTQNDVIKNDTQSKPENESFFFRSSETSRSAMDSPSKAVEILKVPTENPSHAAIDADEPIDENSFKEFSTGLKASAIAAVDPSISGSFDASLKLAPKVQQVSEAVDSNISDAAAAIHDPPTHTYNDPFDSSSEKSHPNLDDAVKNTDSESHASSNVQQTTKDLAPPPLPKLDTEQINDVSRQSSPMQDSSFCLSSPEQPKSVEASALETKNIQPSEKLEIQEAPPASQSRSIGAKLDFNGSPYQTFSDFLMSSAPISDRKAKDSPHQNPSNDKTMKPLSRPPSNPSLIPRPSTSSANLAPSAEPRVPAKRFSFSSAPTASASTKKAILQRANAKIKSAITTNTAKFSAGGSASIPFNPPPIKRLPSAPSSPTRKTFSFLDRATPSPKKQDNASPSHDPDTPSLMADLKNILNKVQHPMDLLFPHAQPAAAAATVPSVQVDSTSPLIGASSAMPISSNYEEVRTLQAKLAEAESENAKLLEEIVFLEHLREQEAKINNLGLSSTRLQSSDPKSLALATQEDIERVKKEILEQENLIKGYQHENEKLTDQVKTLKKIHKDSESRSFLRIETLQREIQALKQGTAYTDNEAINAGEPGVSTTHTQQHNASSTFGAVKLAARVDELQEKLASQTRDAVNREERLTGEITKLRAQLSDATHQLESFQGCSREEVDALKQGWMAEKQRLEAFIVGLEVWLEREVSLKEMLLEKQQYDSQLESRASLVEHVLQPKAARDNSGKGRTSIVNEGKRVKDLEKLVSELQEKVSRQSKWWKESLSELIVANKPSMEEAVYIRHLKDHVKRLQNDLEEREASWNSRLEFMENETAAAKSRYDEKVAELQQRILEVKASPRHEQQQEPQRKKPTSSSPNRNDEIHLHDLEWQLENLLMRYHEKLTEATDADISEHLTKAESSIARAYKVREAKLRSRIVELENMVDGQATTMETMRADRAAAEREAALRAQMRDALVTSYENKISSLRKEFHERVFAGEEQKLLTEIHKLRMEVESLRGENSDLKNRLEISEETRKSVHENTIAILKQAQEESAKIALAHHERALSMLRDETKSATAALLDAEVRRLQRALSDAEVQVTRLQQKCAELEHEKTTWIRNVKEYEDLSETLVSLETMKETVKELQILNADLQRQLQVARSSWPPDRRRFNELEIMLQEMETGFRKRELELQELIHLTRRDAEGEVARVKAKYIPLLEKKDREMMYFRDEMDRLVEGLEKMGKEQGIRCV